MADILILGTGATIRPLHPSTRKILSQMGMRLEVLDTRNAASQFNLLATERGVQEIAAVLLPVGFGGSPSAGKVKQRGGKGIGWEGRS